MAASSVCSRWTAARSLRSSSKASTPSRPAASASTSGGSPRATARRAGPFPASDDSRQGRPGAGPPHPSPRSARIDRQRRGHLGQHPLERVLRAEPLARDPLGHLAHEAPLLAHRGRAAQPDLGGGLGIGQILDIRLPRVLADLLLEAPRGLCAGARDPGLLVLRRGHAREQPHLAPRQHVRDERMLQGREPRERAIHPREVVELAGGEPRPLARVVRQAGVAQALVRPARHHPCRDRRQHPPQRTHARREPHQPIL